MPDSPPPDENHDALAPPAVQPGLTSAKTVITPTQVLALVIIALIGIILFMVLHGPKGKPAVTSQDATSLQAEADAVRSQLNRERLAMGLQPVGSSTESVEDVAARLKKDADTMVALGMSFQTMLGEKDAELRARNTELLRSEQIRQSLAAESQRLQLELQRALVSGSEADLLRRDLATSKSQHDTLAAELDAARKQLAAKGDGASKEDLADLQRRLEETLRAKEFFEAKVKELQGELAGVKTKLFANSENELLPAAVELFRRLRKLENLPTAEISAEYGKLGVDLGASVLKTFNFPTGSAGLTPADEESIRRMVNDIPDGDLVLAIGYASETGNVDKNRTLSSDRATAVAQVYSSAKRPGQFAQAVYLGQTDRFDSHVPERNQIVEIWRIQKK